MSIYDPNELQRLIERYRNDLMKQYAVSPVNAVLEETATITEPVQIPSTQTDMNVETDTGSLQVRVSTENRAVPLVGAVVTVTRKDGEKAVLVRTMVTDDSGLTPLIDLPAKDRTLSLSPGNEQPFSAYSVEVIADGYYPKRFIDLPIYGGVTAVQSVSMIPLPESGNSDTVLVYPQGAPAISLEGGGVNAQ